MRADGIRRWGLWAALAATVYLALALEEPPEERADSSAVSRPMPSRSVAPEAGQAETSGKRAVWQEDALADPFQPMTWYVPPQAERKPSASPTAPPLPFVYFGKMAEGDESYAFLEQGERVRVVRTGEVIDGTYRVEAIGPDAVTFVYLPLNVPQTAAMGARNQPDFERGAELRRIAETMGEQRADPQNTLEEERGEQNEK